MTLYLYPHIATLLFFLSFNVFGRAHSRSSKIIACCLLQMLACDSVPESESAKFCRLQLRLRIQPSDSNSGLISDSAALVLCSFIAYTRKNTKHLDDTNMPYYGHVK